MAGDIHKVWLAKHCTFQVKRAHTTCCGLFVLQLFVSRQSRFFCYQEPSAILQLFAWSKAAWPGHGPSSPLGDAVLAAEDSVSAGVAVRGQARPLPASSPGNPGRSRCLGHLQVGPPVEPVTLIGLEVRPHPCFFPPLANSLRFKFL